MDYNEENALQRQRLYDLTNGLNEEALGRKLKNGWTVASALIHLAFWDQYYLALLEEWEKSAGATLGNFLVTSRGLNVDAINSGIEFISLSIPLPAAVELVRNAADSIDCKVRGIPQGAAVAILESEHHRILRRSIHRREHLDHIERVLR
jgi:hypothetical protein